MGRNNNNGRRAPDGFREPSQREILGQLAREQHRIAQSLAEVRSLALGASNFPQVGCALVRLGLVEEDALVEAIEAERVAYTEEVNRARLEGDSVDHLAMRLTSALVSPIVDGKVARIGLGQGGGA